MKFTSKNQCRTFIGQKNDSLRKIKEIDKLLAKLMNNKREKHKPLI